MGTSGEVRLERNHFRSKARAQTHTRLPPLIDSFHSFLACLLAVLESVFSSHLLCDSPGTSESIPSRHLAESFFSCSGPHDSDAQQTNQQPDRTQHDGALVLLVGTGYGAFAIVVPPFGTRRTGRRCDDDRGVVVLCGDRRRRSSSSHRVVVRRQQQHVLSDPSSSSTVEFT